MNYNNLHIGHTTLIFCLVFIFINKSFGQISWVHQNTIKDLIVDENHNIYVLDNSDSWFSLEDREFRRLEGNNFSKLVNENLFYDGLKIFKIEKEKWVEVYESSKPFTQVWKDEENIYLQVDQVIQIWDGKNLISCQYSDIKNRDKVFINELDDKHFALDSLGMRELCPKDNLDMIYRKLLQPSCTEVKAENEIYIGTVNKGVWMFKEGQFKQLFIPGVFIPRSIKRLLSRDNYLWILSIDNQLMTVDLNSQVSTKIEDGVQQFALDKWNTLFFVKQNQLYKKTQFKNQLLPDLEILNVFIDSKLQKKESKIELDQSEELKIQVSTHYSPSEKLNCQYQINPNGEWLSMETDNTLTLPKLKPGSYQLLFRATSDNKYYSQMSKLKVTVKGSFFKSNWPFVFGGLGLLFLLTLFSQNRMSRQNMRLKEEKEKLKLQLEVLKAQQKFGQLQLNPHFLFNTLNSISGLIALNKNKEARKALNSFSQMMRSLLDNSFKDKITLKEEIEFLEKYLTLEKLIRNDSFSFNILSEETEVKIPPMMIQPFLENAVIHGLKHKKIKGELKVHFTNEDKYVKVEIEDNGIGREAAKAFKSEGHQSNAIRIITDRLRSLDKWNKLNVIEYIDLVENEIPSGTKVVLKIPKQ